MKPVSVSFAKNNLSALLRKVRAGLTVTITDRGVPVAQLVGPAAATGVSAQSIELAERGLIRLPEREPSAEWFRGRLPKLTGTRGVTAVDALIEERRSGR